MTTFSGRVEEKNLYTTFLDGEELPFMLIMMRRKLTTFAVDSKPSQKFSSGKGISRFYNPERVNQRVDEMYACRPMVCKLIEDRKVITEAIESNKTLTLTPIGQNATEFVKNILPTFIG